MGFRAVHHTAAARAPTSPRSGVQSEFQRVANQKPRVVRYIERSVFLSFVPCAQSMAARTVQSMVFLPMLIGLTERIAPEYRFLCFLVLTDADCPSLRYLMIYPLDRGLCTL